MKPKESLTLRSEKEVRAGGLRIRNASCRPPAPPHGELPSATSAGPAVAAQRKVMRSLSDRIRPGSPVEILHHTQPHESDDH